MGMNFNVGLFHHPALLWVAIGSMALIAMTTLTIAKGRNWIEGRKRTTGLEPATFGLGSRRSTN